MNNCEATLHVMLATPELKKERAAALLTGETRKTSELTHIRAFMNVDTSEPHYREMVEVGILEPIAITSSGVIIDGLIRYQAWWPKGSI